MSLTKVELHVETRPSNRVLNLLCQILFWVLLIGAIAVSRLYLGGSFIVEVLATIFALVVLVHIAKRHSGAEITMSVSEVDAWIRDGAPTDVKEWLAARSAKVVGGRP
ncbi:hypothetical protein [Bradyrhizobium embrapense]|uniref:hypothetical protein n=1 Tax=Bradyrhizobium embrapense TaxID=630921 RepID=UPI00067B4E68|nr:hypothetical protein [Bradyrhizobium embrapense]